MYLLKVGEDGGCVGREAARTSPAPYFIEMISIKIVSGLKIHGLR
jgi:hypothetical protein